MYSVALARVLRRGPSWPKLRNETRELGPSRGQSEHRALSYSSVAGDENHPSEASERTVQTPSEHLEVGITADDLGAKDPGRLHARSLLAGW